MSAPASATSACAPSRPGAPYAEKSQGLRIRISRDGEEVSSDDEEVLSDDEEVPGAAAKGAYEQAMQEIAESRAKGGGEIAMAPYVRPAFLNALDSSSRVKFLAGLRMLPKVIVVIYAEDERVEDYWDEGDRDWYYTLNAVRIAVCINELELAAAADRLTIGDIVEEMKRLVACTDISVSMRPKWVTYYAYALNEREGFPIINEDADVDIYLHAGTAAFLILHLGAGDLLHAFMHALQDAKVAAAETGDSLEPLELELFINLLVQFFSPYDSPSEYDLTPEQAAWVELVCRHPASVASEAVYNSTSIKNELPFLYFTLKASLKPDQMNVLFPSAPSVSSPMPTDAHSAGVPEPRRSARKRKFSSTAAEEAQLAAEYAEAKNLLLESYPAVGSASLTLKKDETKGVYACAASAIPKGAFVCEYAGDLLTEAGAKAAVAEYDAAGEKDGNKIGCYMFYIRFGSSRKYCIDSTRPGRGYEPGTQLEEHEKLFASTSPSSSSSTSSSHHRDRRLEELGYGLARYCSHSRTNPNLTLKLFDVPSTHIRTNQFDGSNASAQSVGVMDPHQRYPRLCFFANRSIQAGDELTLDYGDFTPSARREYPWLAV
jgi:hypothetical protein